MEKKKSRKRNQSKQKATASRARKTNARGRSFQGMTPRSMLRMGQQRVRLELPGEPVNLVTTVTSGLIAYSDKFDPTIDVEDWSTRFTNTFEEYRILGVRVLMVPSGGGSNATPIGITKVWFDEKYAGTPGLGEAVAKSTWTLSNAASHKQRTSFKWRANDVGDENFNALVNSPTGTAWFKVYTDNTHFNSPITATSLWILQTWYMIEFRGIEEQ